MSKLEIKCWVLWFIGAILVLLMVSCKPKQLILTNEVIKTIETTEVIRDTVFRTEVDSSFYSAFVECINNKPVLKSPTSTGSKNIKPPKVTLEDSILKVDCVTIAQDLFFQWKEKYIKEFESNNKTEPIYINNPLKWYEKTLMGVGSIALVIVFVGLGFLTKRFLTK